MISKLDLYKVFRVVAQSASFSNAARKLFMTQPAISQSIMQLENELDIRLFNRTPQGVSLTNEGKLLFEYVNSAINLLKVGEEKIAEVKNLIAGELRIGVGDTISKYFLLPYLETFRNQYPQIKFKIVNGTTIELCEVLKSGEVDIAICNLPIVDKTIDVQPCFRVQDTFVYGEKFKKLLDRPVQLEELLNLPLIFLEPKSNSRRYVEAYISKQGFKLDPEFELGSHGLLLEFAKINLGIACVTREFSLEYLETGLLQEVDLIEQIPARHVGICSLQRVALSPAATRFVKLLEEKSLLL